MMNTTPLWFHLSPQIDQGPATPVNGMIHNGDACSDMSTPDIPAIEVSPSDTPPASIPDEDTAARDISLTPPALGARSAVTPGRRAMEALNKVGLYSTLHHSWL